MSDKEPDNYLMDIRDWIRVAVIFGIVFAVMLNGGGILIVAGMGFLHNFIYYDVLGNEKYPYGYPSVPSYSPIEECDFSKDRHLCYQLSRIADALENKTVVDKTD